MKRRSGFQKKSKLPVSLSAFGKCSGETLFTEADASACSAAPELVLTGDDVVWMEQSFSKKHRD